MADRTIAPLGDAFLVWTAVIASLTAQLLLTMLGLGAGIVAVGYAIDPQNAAWAALLWWAASGILAAGIGGAVIGALGDNIDDTRKALLALLAWATAILIVALLAALATAGGASLAGMLGGPLAGYLAMPGDAPMTDEMRQTMGAVAVSSVVALLLGAAAQVAGAIYGPETTVRVAKRA